MGLTGWALKKGQKETYLIAGKSFWTYQYKEQGVMERWIIEGRLHKTWAADLEVVWGMIGEAVVVKMDAW